MGSIYQPIEPRRLGGGGFGTVKHRIGTESVTYLDLDILFVLIW